MRYVTPPMPMPPPGPRSDRFDKLTIERVENGLVISLGHHGFERHVFSSETNDGMMAFLRAWLAGLEPKS